MPFPVFNLALIDYLAAGWQYFPSLLPTLIGGGIAILSAWITTNRQFTEERKRRKKEADDKVRATLSAIFHELDSVWRRYMSSMGIEIEKVPPDGQRQAFLIRYPLISEYFPIYHANADKIGLVPNKELRNALVEAYTFAKALMDSYKMNNQLILESTAAHIRYYDSIPGGTPSITDAEKRRKQADFMLDDYGPKLRALHHECRGKAEALLKQLAIYNV